MSANHALPDPTGSVWAAADPISKSGTFLKVGSVVPFTAPVLTFQENGTAVGLLSESVADEIRAEINALGITWPNEPVQPPKSGSCGETWPDYCGEWICTLDPHDEVQEHEAWGTGTDKPLASTPVLKEAS